MLTWLSLQWQIVYRTTAIKQIFFGIGTSTSSQCLYSYRFRFPTEITVHCNTVASVVQWICLLERFRTTSVFDKLRYHYSGDIISTMASQIASVSIVYSAVGSGADQRKRQISASLAFVGGIHRWPHKRASNAENVSISWRHHGN